MVTKTKPTTWKFESRTRGWEQVLTLTAYWEVERDPISDEYDPSDISAADLFASWTKVAYKQHPNGLIPIYWSVKGDGVSETMPFQYDHFDGFGLENFLTYFTWPKDAKTGDPVNWMTLPVADKLWQPGRADTGGFIQEVTGWKPSILQPYVYLPALEKGIRIAPK